MVAQSCTNYDILFLSCILTGYWWFGYHIWYILRPGARYRASHLNIRCVAPSLEWCHWCIMDYLFSFNLIGYMTLWIWIKKREVINTTWSKTNKNDCDDIHALNTAKQYNFARILIHLFCQDLQSLNKNATDTYTFTYIVQNNSFFQEPLILACHS